MAKIHAIADEIHAVINICVRNKWTYFKYAEKIN